MDGMRILAGEAIIALGVVAWRNIKGGYAPLPHQLILSGLSFGIISLIGYVSDDLAAILGAGFLLAILIKEFQHPSKPNEYQGPKGYSTDNLIMLKG